MSLDEIDAKDSLRETINCLVIDGLPLLTALSRDVTMKDVTNCSRFLNAFWLSSSENLVQNLQNTGSEMI